MIEDPRRAARKAVYAYLRDNPPDGDDDYARAVANARVWRAVHIALDAMGIPEVSISDLYPYDGETAPPEPDTP